MRRALFRLLAHSGNPKKKPLNSGVGKYGDSWINTYSERLYCF